MTTNQMRYFITVCENLSFSKAAETLYISQPAISKHIAALEKELGEPLFERHSKRKLVLTKAGEVYLSAFRASLENLDTASLRVKYIDRREKLRYRIGLPENWQLAKLVRFCRESVESNLPNVLLQFELLPHSVLNTRRIDGTLDMALTIDGAYSPVYGYTTLKLTQILSTVLLSAEHPLAGKPDLSLKDLQEFPFLVPPGSEIQSIRNQDPMLLQNGKAMLWTDISNLATICMNVAAGYGYAILDEWSYETRDPRFYAIKMPDLYRNSVIASWKQNEHEDIAEAVLAQMRHWIDDPIF